jgi:membrane-associated phospholipid phosphatase
MIIILVSLYHYLIQNGLEKQFSMEYLNCKYFKRPLNECIHNNKNFKCIGMPSRHAEIASIIAFLMYSYNFISLPICLIFISIFAAQRVIKHFHTIFQVIVGIFLGYIYASIYKKFDFSVYSFAIVIGIGIMLHLLTIYKLYNHISMK